jgi:hypothetical protein
VKGLIRRIVGNRRAVSPGFGEAYGQLIVDQLIEERARKTSIEQRGVGVVTTSGVLVTLLFGLSALATSSPSYKLPDPARWTLLFAVVLFLVASVLGLITNWALGYTEVTTNGMRQLVEPEQWLEGSPEAARQSAEARVDIIEGFRTNNQMKGWILRAAMGLQILAVAMLALSVAVVLWVR